MDATLFNDPEAIKKILSRCVKKSDAKSIQKKETSISKNNDRTFER
jgi:hypothetical protein